MRDAESTPRCRRVMHAAANLSIHAALRGGGYDRSITIIIIDDFEPRRRACASGMPDKCRAAGANANGMLVVRRLSLGEYEGIGIGTIHMPEATVLAAHTRIQTE
jgi:hypothetical protein